MGAGIIGGWVILFAVLFASKKTIFLNSIQIPKIMYLRGKERIRSRKRRLCFGENDWKFALMS
ncbi:MAG: hypothetical protein IE918_08940 [Campylobacterales bacterium]|nr:hypothetical protein [Campylobacterales bacterium]